MRKYLALILTCIIVIVGIEMMASARPLLTPQPVVYRATLSGVRFSTVAGTSFLDNAGATVPTFADGLHSIEIYDSAGRLLKGVLSAAGTEETLDSEKLTGPWANSATHPYETFASVAVDITAVNTTVYGRTASNAMTNTLGELYKYTGALTLTSGQAPTLALGVDSSGFSTGSAQAVLSAGANTKYLTCPDSTHDYLGLINTSAANFAIPDGSLKKVLAPSTSGAVIVSEKGGATQNWTVNQWVAGSYNAASYQVIVRALR